MNKTQLELVSRLVNRYDTGSAKKGWTLTVPSIGHCFLSLQRLNEINQAYKLAETYPEVFKAIPKVWRLTLLELVDENKARELIKGIA